MLEAPRDPAGVNARIVYWGIEGAGKTTNLRAVYAKLRPDHRGELREVVTRMDPSVSYEVLPIELGEVAGVRTRIQILCLPGAPEQAPTRKQLLDQVDGIVLVIDSQRERIDENVGSFDELRSALSAYGRSLEDIPLVVQYNKRDLADPYALEELHRKLQLSGISVFEAVASEGTGVLQTLSTISKKVIRSLRDPSRIPSPLPRAERAPEPAATIPRPPAEPPDLLPDYGPRIDQLGDDGLHADSRRTLSSMPIAPSAPAAADLLSSDSPRVHRRSPIEELEEGMLNEESHSEADAIAATVERAEALLDVPWDRVSDEIAPEIDPLGARDLSIVSVGEAARAGDRAVRVPLVLGDSEGTTTSLVLTIQIDPLTYETGD